MRPGKKIVGLLCILFLGGFLLSTSHSLAARAGSYTVNLPVVVNRYPLQTVFGTEMKPISDEKGLQQMADAGTYWVRRNAVLWSQVEPVQGGGYDWSVLAGLEAELLLARQHGMEVILIVRGVPDWARASPYYQCGPIDPAALPAFGNFMQALVQRYSQSPYRVKYWEIWNEPDVSPQAVPNPNAAFGCLGIENDPYYGGREYADILKAVYPKIKAADPAAQVLVGGLLLDCAPNGSPNCTTATFLEGILVNNGKDFFDGVSFHAYDYYSTVVAGQYGTYGNPNWNSGYIGTQKYGDLKPVLVAKANYLQSVLAAYGANDKYLLNTETALLCGSIGDPPGGPGCESDPDSPFETLKASYVAQSYAAAMGEGLIGNLWFSPLGWRNSGLLNEDLTTRPAYDAFVLARNTLKDATFVREVDEFVATDQVFGYEFQVEGGTIWVLWSLDGAPRDIDLPGIPAAAWDAVGNPISAGTGTLSISRLNTVYVQWSP